jgi:hypothetical protein
MTEKPEKEPKEKKNIIESVGLSEDLKKKLEEQKKKKLPSTTRGKNTLR